MRGGVPGRPTAPPPDCSLALALAFGLAAKRPRNCAFWNARTLTCARKGHEQGLLLRFRREQRQNVAGFVLRSAGLLPSRSAKPRLDLRLDFLGVLAPALEDARPGASSKAAVLLEEDQLLTELALHTS